MGEKKVYTVICQKWEESERGWGRRPDGYSLHLTDADREIYIKAYWDRMPDSAPDEYSLPEGTPYPCEVSAEIYEEIKKGKRHGIRAWGSAPYPGGTDGWVSENRGTLPRLVDVHCVECFRAPCKCKKVNA